MPGIVIGVLISFFAIIGLAETLRGIKNYLLSPKQERAAFVLSCKGHDEQIEYNVRALANQATELRFHGQALIIILDEGMDDETRGICETLARDIEGVTVCRSYELPLLFGGELQN